MKTLLARTLAAASLGLTLLAAPTLANAESVALPAPTEPAAKGSIPLPSEVQQRQTRYAEREAASPNTADFEGKGAAVYIGGSTLAVVLVIVLLVVLL